jgi:hypothetical protein
MLTRIVRSECAETRNATAPLMAGSPNTSSIVNGVEILERQQILEALEQCNWVGGGPERGRSSSWNETLHLAGREFANSESRAPLRNRAAMHSA